jgi:hypothetical protein
MTLSTGSVLAIDTPLTTLAEAEHSLLGLGEAVDLPADVLVCTHEVRDGTPHYAFSVTSARWATDEATDGLLTQVGDYFGDWPAVFEDGSQQSQRPLLIRPAAPSSGSGSGSGSRSVPFGAGQALDETRRDETRRDETRRRDAGRAVRFGGCLRLTGSLPIAEVLAASAIDRIALLGGGTVAPDWQLSTRGFVRPRWQRGELVLAVLAVLAVLPAGPATGPATVAPFEVPNPTPCCAAH